MRRLGIDCLSVFAMPPVPFIQLAADLGCHFITLGLPVRFNPESYPAYSLDDPVTRRETNALAAGFNPITRGHTASRHRLTWPMTGLTAPCSLTNCMATRFKVRRLSFEAVTCTCCRGCECRGAG